MNRRIFSLLVTGVFVTSSSVSGALAEQELKFKFYTPPDAQQPASSTPAKADSAAQPQADTATASGDAASSGSDKDKDSEFNANDFAEPANGSQASAGQGAKASAPASSANTDDQTTKTQAATSDAATQDDLAKPAADAQTDKTSEDTTKGAADKTQIASKVLQGYIRVVPSGTKIPIIMDTPVDSDTSQEGDEFTARSGEDLLIDGNTVLPAGSVIKGRIARINPPKHMGRSGSVAFKFDTVTTPDNRQIPIVANLVAHGGVVHAKRGMKDIAIDAGTLALPTAAGLGIGLLAGSSSTTTSTTGTSTSGISKGTAAVIGVGVGAAVGVAILCIKKGHKVDVRPGDELKIELAEDLRMPM